MTTNGTKQVSVAAALKRADQRWVKDQEADPADPDYLNHLATFLQPVVKAEDVKPAGERDLTLLREQAAAAETNAAARRAELDQARAEIEKLRQQAETAQHEATRSTDALESARRERDQLAEQLTEARKTAPEPMVDLEKVREQARLIGQLRADYDAAITDHQKTTAELAGVRADLAVLQTERDQLAEAAKRLGETAHNCTWQWRGPDSPIEPCKCGRPVPRFELREVG